MWPLLQSSPALIFITFLKIACWFNHENDTTFYFCFSIIMCWLYSHIFIKHHASYTVCVLCLLIHWESKYFYYFYELWLIISFIFLEYFYQAHCFSIKKFEGFVYRQIYWWFLSDFFLTLIKKKKPPRDLEIFLNYVFLSLPFWMLHFYF